MPAEGRDPLASRVVFPIPINEPEMPVAAIYTSGFSFRPPYIALVLWEDGRLLWHEDAHKLVGPATDISTSQTLSSGVYWQVRIPGEQIAEAFLVLQAGVPANIPKFSFHGGVPVTHVSLGRKRWEFEYTLMHPIHELHDPNILWTPTAIIQLEDGQTRDQMMKNQPSDSREYRAAADEAIATLLALIPEDRNEAERLGFLRWDFRREGYSPPELEIPPEFVRKMEPRQ